MSPPRRRSARLASSVKSKATPELGSVAEAEETPCKSRTRNVEVDTTMESPFPEPSTPASSALKPPRSEMHPSKYHFSTGDPSSALRLGFSDIPKEAPTPGCQDRTPSKVNRVPSSSFTFRVARESADTELSGEAQRMLKEIRNQAAKIKAELVAQREAEGGVNIGDRPFAKPKGKVGRYSAAHMAEFKKMDSIEGHASAWRAQEGRFTPVKALKRTPSKANLDGTPTSQKSVCIQRSPAKTVTDETSNSRPKPNLKRKSSAADLDSDNHAASKRHNESANPGKCSITAPENRTPTAKRVKQRREDDAAIARPGHVEFSPAKPTSIFSRLATPRKAAAAPSPISAKIATKPATSSVQSPLKSSLHSVSMSVSGDNLNPPVSKASELKRRIISPRSFSKVKSILRGSKTGSEEGVSAIPHPQVSRTPAPPRVNKELPPIPLTTPRRKLTKRVTFTPEVVSAANVQNSPSPQRRGNFKLRPALKSIETHYPALDAVLTESTPSSSLYPDLSPLKHLMGSQSQRVVSESPSMAGTFTFRSDRTIKFGDAPSTGFGASPGQSSVRHVSGPVVSSNMPGSFPAPPSPNSHPNKENKAPSLTKLLPGTAHGMQNKKRHRATADEDDFETERAAKKRKNENVPEGQALLAPRLAKVGSASATKNNRFTRTPVKAGSSRTSGKTPVRTSVVASPKKKVTGLSMSRLNMLAQPKNRA
ncbi:hypothetical protein X797_007245 [Metarhizium robertsii]|uniref:Erythromycin esterase n=2 Tax=Metarhizium robertsii TaxID=568076 RepID=E9F463_METRA|nr:uncharacterized protein MAA_07062 [Metarhizium robertsii ARSEF 23]EFY97420.2 hypothetical protein MAA_07062 [Metarhizium robertsii ARSEF 23]EXU99779.1 hypothetical protein X797_007245 [Metarhizium robertsii]